VLHLKIVNRKIFLLIDLRFYFYLVWADNADAVSLQYAGTGALKTDYTRYYNI